jgi:hypothetical protein
VKILKLMAGHSGHFVLFFAVTAAVKVIGIAFISAHHSSKASNAREPA